MSLHNLLELGAVPEPNADWLGCCPNTGGWLLLDTVPKVGGCMGWEPAENNAVEDDIEPKLGGLGWLAPWLCPNVGVWLAPNAGLADGAECPVPNTKEDPGDQEILKSVSRFILRSPLGNSLNSYQFQAIFQTLTLITSFEWLEQWYNLLQHILV